jgi:single-strand DNA-binding protein
MASYNKVILLGNLCRDPELRITPKGSSIAQISLAVNRKWKDDAGQQKEEVTFIDCEAWGKQADTIAKYLTKGRPLFIEGRLKLDTWEDKNGGGKRSKLKVVIESFQFVGARDTESREPTYSPSPDINGNWGPPAQPPPAPRQTTMPHAPDAADEDVPF